jgi:hypothetical protein
LLCADPIQTVAAAMTASVMAFQETLLIFTSRFQWEIQKSFATCRTAEFDTVSTVPNCGIPLGSHLDLKEEQTA